MKNIASMFITLVFIILLNNVIYTQPVGIDLLWEKAVDVKTMKFTPNGDLLVTGGSNNNCYPYTCGQLKVWGVADSTLLNTIENAAIGLTNDIDISTDGQKIISGHGSVYCSAFHGCLRDRAGQFTFNINGSQMNTVTEPGGNIHSIAYSPNDSIIAAGTGYNNTGEIRIYDSNYNLLRILPGHGLSTDALQFTNDGQYLISGGNDGSIKFWNYNDGTLIRTFQHGTYVNGGTHIKVLLSPDGQYFASAGQGYQMTVKIWEISDGTLLHTFPVENQYYGYSSIEFSPNGLYLANGLTLSDSSSLGWHGRIRFFEVLSGELVREYVDSLGSPNEGGVRALAFSATGNNHFAYSIGYGNSSMLRLAITDIDLVSPTNIVEEETYLPENFALSQNYPNPFNPTTTIKYNLPQSSVVVIQIFNSLGEYIKTLYSGLQTSGIHELVFDGGSLPSGIYYYQLTTKNFTQTKKCLLLK